MSQRVDDFELSPGAEAPCGDEQDRRLGPDEFEAWVRAPIDPVEAEELDGLIDWFQRRYPTPASRLAYARRRALALRRLRAHLGP
jgi:hypothetical protein